MFDRLAELERKFDALGELLGSPGIAADPARYREHAKAFAELERIVSKFREFRGVEAEIRQAKELLRSPGDEEIRRLAEDEVASLQERLRGLESDLRRLLLPRDPNDDKNVILEVRAGTGGDEASLFAQEIFRMYGRYAERRGWKVELLSANPTGMGGVKEAIALIEGRGAYSRLRHESGVHRVQRVPATESSGRIHTSAVTVAVLPEAEEVEVRIDEKDLRVDRFCSTGPGGQSVNTTASAVRVTHLPTGLVVSCQDEKSQHKNLARAMRVLRSRLLDLARSEQQEAIARDRRAQVGTGDRSEKIRTYNFPQSRVSDHRIHLNLSRLDAVLDGDLDLLIDPLIAHFEAERLDREVRV
ncbi:MAG: peptide chain release factor 1 [Acidobacteria bacterium]|nr:peptide chain release factor 1 [Acidobacteriota bacterium]